MIDKDLKFCLQDVYEYLCVIDFNLFSSFLIYFLLFRSGRGRHCKIGSNELGYTMSSRQPTESHEVLNSAWANEYDLTKKVNWILYCHWPSDVLPDSLWWAVGRGKVTALGILLVL